MATMYSVGQGSACLNQSSCCRIALPIPPLLACENPQLKRRSCSCSWRSVPILLLKYTWFSVFFLWVKVDISSNSATFPYWCLVRNGWEWGNGIIIHSYCGSFPHSLLSTSKFLSKDSKIGPSDHRQPFANQLPKKLKTIRKRYARSNGHQISSSPQMSHGINWKPKKSSNQAANQPLFMEKLSKSSGSQPASVLPSRSCTKSILYQVVIVCLCIYI